MLIIAIAIILVGVLGGIAHELEMRFRVRK